MNFLMVFISNRPIWRSCRRVEQLIIVDWLIIFNKIDNPMRSFLDSTNTALNIMTFKDYQKNWYSWYLQFHPGSYTLMSCCVDGSWMICWCLVILILDPDHQHHQEVQCWCVHPQPPDHFFNTFQTYCNYVFCH